MKKNILLGIFLGGILLIGIGTGIAFAEYSSFRYGGVTVIGDGGTEVDTKIYTIPLDRNTILYNGTSEKLDLIEDKTLKDGQVRVEVVYHSRYAVPYIEHENNSDITLESGSSSYIHIYTNRSIGELEMFMECKDDFLTNLKNHVLKNYRFEPVESVSVKANKTTMNYLVY